MEPPKILLIVFVYLCSVCSLSAQYEFIQEVHEQTQKQQYRAAIGRIDSALKAGNESIDDSVRANLLYIKGYAFENLISSDETAMDSAISNYKLVVSINILPINIAALNTIGCLYGDLGNYEQSIDYFTQILSIDSNNAGALNNIAYDKNQSGAYKEAIVYADKSYKFAEDAAMKSAALNNKGYSYLKLGTLSEALDLINAAIKLRPENFVAYYHKALVYIEQKKFEKVCVNLQKSRELGGINTTAELIKKYCKK